MPVNDTIAAISTPPGRGGIGIVRLSGPESLAISAPLLRLRNPLSHAQARFAEVLDEDGNILDQAVVTFFAAPNSYTSEDLVEIAAHGAPVLLDHLLRQCLARGARLAEPGEFTQRAFLAGRIDLTQAEAVRDLIDATTLHQARIAARQLGGALAHTIRPVKETLVSLIAALEAGIDFAEDDIDVLPNAAILDRLAAIHAPLRALADSYAYGRIVRDGLTLAIAGRPNAGKSSLFNRLIDRDRAIVTAAPGTTRDPIHESLAIAGIPIQLVDTAGLRIDHPASAERLTEAETIGIAKSRQAIAEADLVLLVLDATQPLNQEEAALLESLQDRPTILIRNKSDLLANDPGAPSSRGIIAQGGVSPATTPGVPRFDSETRELSQADRSAESAALLTSALAGDGIPELRQRILNTIQQGSATESALLTNLRQQQSIQSALDALAKAEAALPDRVPHEMLLLDLYAALRALDSLTGATTTDDILHLIFSTFCIGK